MKSERDELFCLHELAKKGCCSKNWDSLGLAMCLLNEVATLLMPCVKSWVCTLGLSPFFQRSSSIGSNESKRRVQIVRCWSCSSAGAEPVQSGRFRCGCCSCNLLQQAQGEMSKHQLIQRCPVKSAPSRYILWQGNAKIVMAPIHFGYLLNNLQGLRCVISTLQ